MISTAEHERLCRTLLDMVEGGALVCRRDGTIRMHNAEAVHLLGDNGDDEDDEDAFSNGPQAHVREGASVCDVLRSSVLEPALQAAAHDAVETPIRLIVRRLAEQWVQVCIRRVGPPQGTEALLLIHVQPQTPWADADAESHHVLRTLIEDMRGPLSSIRASIETMVAYPDMDAATASQFTQIIEEQAVLLTSQLETATDRYTRLYRHAWPLMRTTGHDLLHRLRPPLQAVPSVPLSITVTPAAEAAHIRVDTEAIAQLMAVLVERIAHATRCDALLLRVDAVPSHVAFDLQWEGRVVTDPRLTAWMEDTLTWGAPPVEMSMREVIDHHDAQIGSQREGDNVQIRLLLPIVAADASPAAPASS